MLLHIILSELYGNAHFVLTFFLSRDQTLFKQGKTKVPCKEDCKGGAGVLHLPLYFLVIYWNKPQCLVYTILCKTGVNNGVYWNICQNLNLTELGIGRHFYIIKFPPFYLYFEFQVKIKIAQSHTIKWKMMRRFEPSAWFYIWKI